MFSSKSLSKNLIRDVSALGAALAANTTLATLQYQLYLTDILFNFLPTLCIARRLNDNHISDVSVLGAALATNTALTTLEYEMFFSSYF
jgi:hypothetical protein